MKNSVLASVFIGLFITGVSSSIFADDYPEATAAILNEIIRKEADSNQIEIGPSWGTGDIYVTCRTSLVSL